MPWFYSRTTRILRGPAGSDVAQSAPGISLPEGEYLIGDLIPTHKDAGVNVLPLISHPQSPVSEYFILGNSVSKISSGRCIVLPLWARMQISGSDDRVLQVVA